MRLLQVSLRSLLLYSLVLVVISIPVSIFSIRAILNKEVDESLSLNAEQFLLHIKNFEYLDDLETDLHVLDQLSYNVHIKPAIATAQDKLYQTISLYDSIEKEEHPFRQLSTGVMIKEKPYLLTVRMSLVDNDDLIIAIGVVQVVLIILLATGLLLINRSLSKRLWTPFYNTLSQLKAFELDKNEPIRTEQTNITEFDDLNKTISHLTDRSRTLFLQQKEFIENASHELQTPLAIFQSKLDVLMQQPSISETEANTLSELESTAQRMARLNKNLLLLSKIDNQQFTETESIDLSQITQDLLDKIRPMADMNSLHVATSVNALSIQANRALIEVLLTNLLHNAIRHTPEKGSVSVQIQDRTLTISNSGKPLRMEPGKMFERFSKETRNPNSTGLGLAIVKKICDTCGYTLAYRYTGEFHTFTVSF